MSTFRNNQPDEFEPKGRPLGNTEHGGIKAVSSGTGIVVLALLFSKEPDTTLLQNSLNKIQNAHPILRSKLHRDTPSNTYSIIVQPKSHVQFKSFNLSNTSNLLQSLSNPSNTSLSPFEIILQHELTNNKVWVDPETFPSSGVDTVFATVYTCPGSKWVVVVRIHGVVCDRTASGWILKEFMGSFVDREGGKTPGEDIGKGEVSLAIEDLIPGKNGKKTLWARGMDMLKYSVKSLRLTNLEFKDVKQPRSSEVVKMQLNEEDTEKLLAGCKVRGIKLFAALTAAGLIAVHSSKSQRKYGFITFTDCRSSLQPSLCTHNYGFYYTCIPSILAVKGGETLWELATKTYREYANAIKSNKHFSDMAELNFLMIKVLENPGLTTSSSLRSSLITVFEEPVIYESNEILHSELGLEDFVACTSVHGIGSSLVIYDSIRDRKLDCLCGYPSPLHSREQMQELVDNIKRILVDEGKCDEVDNKK